MVFKKPYAFLIKNFKIIHILLSLIILFIVIQYSRISSFFGDYVSSLVRGNVSLPPIEINILLFLAIIIVIIFNLLMFLLMQNKKKPTIFYMLALGYYSVMLVAVLYAASIFSSLETTQLTQQAARVNRDVFLMISFPQFYFLIMSVVRGVGFDVKKFDFGKDLQELEIDAKDSEEFEFVLGTDTYVYKRKLRRTLREMKYYFFENKLIILGILGAIVGIVLIFYLVNTTFINRVYRSGTKATIGNFTYRLNSAFVTEYDYNGRIIKEGSKYVIVNMNVTNNHPTLAREIDRLTLYLNFGDTNVYHQSSPRSNFIDIGRAYINESINSRTSRDIVFIFEINNRETTRNFILKILDNIETGPDNQPIYNYVDYRISARDINRLPTRREYELNRTVVLGDIIFGKSTLKITDVQISNRYEFKHELCTDQQCRTVTDILAPENAIINDLLIITYELDIDERISFNDNMTSDKYFFDRFLSIESNRGDRLQRQRLTVSTYRAIPNKLFTDILKANIGTEGLNLVIETRETHHHIDISSIGR